MPRASKVKKLVLVSTTCALVTGASKENQEVIVLVQVSCIHYTVQFQKNKATIQTLINSGSEVNAITPAYAKQLGFWTRKTDIGAQKIDGSLLATYGIVIAAFHIIDKLGRAWFFQETFLLADTTMEVVLAMLFLTINNTNIQFAEKELTWRSYITKKALPTTR